MALKESTKSSKYQKYPSFELKGINNKSYKSINVMGDNGLIILFTCNHCPYAKALWNRIINDYKEIQSHGFSFIAINPNINPQYPEDSFENMVILSDKLDLPFPYLVDEDQQTAKDYNAQSTPDIYVLNNNMELLYRGAYDDNWKDENNV